MPRDLWVDFNGMDSQGRITTCARWAGLVLAEGMAVRVSDDDGTEADAIIERIERGLVQLRVNLDSSEYADET